MNSRRPVGWKGVGLLGAASLLLFSLSACFWRSSPPPATASPAPFEQSVLKPRPRVTNVVAATAGYLEDYYVILDATVKNDGSEGTVLTIANITQGDKTSTKQMPIFLRKGGSQVVRFIFPLKWKGGEWTPSVTVEVP